MAGSVNKVIIVGNLGQDPEIRSFPNGGRIANLSIATSESWKDKTASERKEKTQWHRVVVVNEALIKTCEQFLKKGAKVYLEGQLETRKYEKDGRDVYITEVVLRHFKSVLIMLDTRGGSGLSNSQTADTYAREGEYQGDGYDGAPAGQQPAPAQGFDDDIPFYGEIMTAEAQPVPMTGAVTDLNIKAWPTNWPTDKRSKSFFQDGFYCLRHPDRAPMKWLPDQRKWVLL